MFKNLFFYSILSLFLLEGCSQINLNIEPKVQANNFHNEQKIFSKIVYDGNPNYLPSILIKDSNSDNVSYYKYNVRYINDSTKYDGLNLFNPLVMVGFPLSHETTIVEGKLTFIDKNKNKKIFTATCAANKTRNLFQNSGSTGARKKCLFAVRDNINKQIIQFIKGGLNAYK